VESFVGPPAYQRISAKWDAEPRPNWTTGKLAWVISLIAAAVVLAIGLWRYRTIARLNRMLREEAEKRRAMERSLAESEVRNSGITDNASDGIVTIDERGLIESFNPAAETIFGYSAQEVTGANVSTLMPEPVARRHDDYLRRYVESGYGTIIGAGPRELTGKRKDGSSFPLEITIDEMFLGDRRLFIGAVRDTSARKEAERDAAEKSALLETTIDTIGHGVIVFDKNMRLVRHNHVIAEQLELPEEILRPGTSLGKFIRFRAERGDYGAGNVEEIFKDQLERARSPHERIGERALPNGMVYSYHRKPMPAGGCVISYTDITALKRAEKEATEKSALLETTIDTIGHGVMVFDKDMRLIRYNDPAAKLLSLPAEVLRPGTSFKQIVRYRAERGDYGDGDLEEIVNGQFVRAKSNPARIRERTLRDGTVYIHHRKPMPGGGCVISYTDITARKQAERESAEKTALLETTIETMAQGYVVYDAELRLVAFNSQYERMFEFPSGFLRPGLPLEEVIRKRTVRWQERAVRGDKDRITRHIERAKDPVERTEERNLTNGLTYVYHRKPLPGGGFITTYTDITQRKRVESALKESEERFRGAFENSGVGIMIRHHPDRSVTANDAFEKMLGYTREEMPTLSLNAITHPEDFAENDRLRRSIVDGIVDNVQATKRLIRKNGEIVWVINDVSAVRDADGTLVYTINLFQDITDGKKAEEDAAEKSRLLEATFQHMVQGVAVYDRHHTLVAYNRQYSEILGLPPGYLHTGMNRADIIRYRTEQGHFGEHDFDGEIETRLANGRSYSYEKVPTPDGGYISTVTDITERREAEQQLHQAQKMEAVGQLTGGIAHDFNNLLAVSLGNVELAEEVVQSGGNVQPFLATVKRASERGASLTSQLLAFSRKQTLFPQVIDAGELVGDMTELLRRALGETIEVKVAVDGDLWPCEVDSSLLESAILNLAINARDAMPTGGALAIRITNVGPNHDEVADRTGVEPGDYVLITVTDTGTGMARDVIDHVFDPFFTTKEVGHGSGLGLSMVYGFVKQSGGHVVIDSEVGKGSSFKLFLPRSRKTKRDGKDGDNDSVPQARCETVLVVEDDPDVRTLSVALLRSLGYEILEASDGKSALKILRSTPGVDLLFTDVVLPGGMSGPDLAAQALRRHPGIAVLYTSGYSDRPGYDGGGINSSGELLQKPYRKVDLARKVRAVLERAPSTAPTADTATR